MRSNTLALLLVLTLALFASPALSAPFGGGGSSGESVVSHIFEVADTDEDGVLSLEEYGSAGLEDFGLSFEACDGDADGRITADEYLDVYRRHHPGHGGIEI